jgi:Domain of unknown function (DUF6371)
LRLKHFCGKMKEHPFYNGAKRAFDERKRYPCPACAGKRSFAIEKGTNLTDGVGYCFACGYNGFSSANTPNSFNGFKQFKNDFKAFKVESSIRYVDGKTAQNSTNRVHYRSNPLYRYLAEKFGESETASVFQLYHVGTTKQGGVAFWTHDGTGFRSCKVMFYVIGETIWLNNRAKCLRLKAGTNKPFSVCI